MDSVNFLVMVIFFDAQRQLTLCRGFCLQSCWAKGSDLLPSTTFLFVLFSLLPCCSKEALRHKDMLESFCPLSLFSENSTSMDASHCILPLLSLLACWRLEVGGQRLKFRGWRSEVTVLQKNIRSFLKAGGLQSFQGSHVTSSTMGFFLSFTIKYFPHRFLLMAQKQQE